MRTKKLNLLPLKALNVDDFFWNKYTRLVTKEIIPYQWKALNDEVADAEPSYCIDNFKVAAGLKEGTFHGWVFQDTDLAKWLEAVAYSLSYEPNEALEKLADDAIDLVGKAQQENGYINTHFSILHPGKQFPAHPVFPETVKRRLIGKTVYLSGSLQNPCVYKNVP